jgi:4-amino-4-deoxy-L-arabinose transferase-like glycosyltransferase
VAALVAAGFLVQASFLGSRRHPTLFGDALGYHRVGQQVRESVQAWRAGEGIETAYGRLKPLAPLAGAGLVYAAADAAWPGDEHALRSAFAAANSLAMLGAFYLARALAGGRLAGVLALVVAVLHPSLSVQTARLLPDPVTGCLWVWAAYFYVEGTRRAARRCLLAAGFALGAGLYVRAQLLAYVAALGALAALASFPALRRESSARKRLAWFAAGFLPLPVLWVASVRGLGGDWSAIEQFGNFTFRQHYPYGFWQFMETDGWMGPYRLKTEPYYLALAAAAEHDRDLLRSRPRQLLFTAGYVAARPRDSLLTVLDNVYRTHDRPPNDYQVDYPYRYAWQVPFHRIVMVLGLSGMAVFAALRPAVAGAFLIPGSLALVHGLGYPWPRFVQPALPIWIACAAAFAAWSVEVLRQAPPPARGALAFFGAAVAAVTLPPLTQDAQPELARLAAVATLLVALAAPFAFAWSRMPRRRWILGTAAAVLVAAAAAHAHRDYTWHETEVLLGPGGSARQEIVLSAHAASRLRTAGEAFVVADVLGLDDAPDGLVVTVNGRASTAERTLPALGDAVVARWRPRWRQRQWYAAPLDTTWLSGSGPAVLRIDLEARSGRWVLFGDRFSSQQARYEGPSFGEWPRLSAVKLEYDGDYRLAARYPLASTATRSSRGGDSGRPRPVRGSWRIRVLTLSNDGGGLRWESAPLPAATRVVLGFAAYSGDRGQARLFKDAAALLSFPLHGSGDFAVEGAGHRLCYVAEGRRGDKPYGAYFLSGPNATPGSPARLEVRFSSGMSIEPMRFIVDTRREASGLEALADRCEPHGAAVFVPGAARLLDAARNSYPDDTGRWTVAEVF